MKCKTHCASKATHEQICTFRFSCERNRHAYTVHDLRLELTYSGQSCSSLNSYQVSIEPWNSARTKLGCMYTIYCCFHDSMLLEIVSFWEDYSAPSFPLAGLEGPALSLPLNINIRYPPLPPYKIPHLPLVVTKVHNSVQPE